MTALLEVENLSVRVPSPDGLVTVVDDVDLCIDEKQVFGLAGESGSGKTMSVLALLGLLPPRSVVEGRAMFEGRDLLSLDRRARREVRGSKIAMIFQDPLTSMHPMLSIGRALTEHLRYHEKLSRRAARARAIELLEEVRIPDPEASLSAFPHQFSGGMRQRISIASALICRPRLLIADEPTTALDVTVQAGIIRLLDRLRSESGLSVIMITHDLGVMSSIAEMLSVMYAGRIVENGATGEVIRHPRHPYTKALIEALPHPEAQDGVPLKPIAGAPPTPRAPVSGCSFHPRCAYAVDQCRESVPDLRTYGQRRFACSVEPLGPP
jgi:oligopeptide/dipeptide ABC transporter ATP-binding protein